MSSFLPVVTHALNLRRVRSFATHCQCFESYDETLACRNVTTRRKSKCHDTTRRNVTSQGDAFQCEVTYDTTQRFIIKFLVFVVTLRLLTDIKVLHNYPKGLRRDAKCHNTALHLATRRNTLRRDVRTFWMFQRLV